LSFVFLPQNKNNFGLRFAQNKSFLEGISVHVAYVVGENLKNPIVNK
jgi:hypothetical protein